MSDLPAQDPTEPDDTMAGRPPAEGDPEVGDAGADRAEDGK